MINYPIKMQRLGKKTYKKKFKTDQNFFVAFSTAVYHLTTPLIYLIL